ncbi:alpha/beta fold hydrolase [Pseudacidobacterium ailaaui]|jgi:pimeloyl-ACP methyl ester carboxylesterase|uniref:alpha/beta fold hydrolase n=1 Tax=Pseudacidobacterium ailaaui TaxID=1382359 RepID=UPI00067976BF|nr:alpha/beta hydrolase [Pseudacidobacterium ailaaui]
MKLTANLLTAAVLVLAIHVVLAQSTPAFHVDVKGKGKAMILIPGLSSSGEVWDSTVARYQDNYRCYVLTLDGFAGQPRWTGPGDDFLNVVRDQLAAYIDKNHLDHPVIVGHSLGGFLALDLAEKYPDKVGPLVIVDALPFSAHAWMNVDSADGVKGMAAGLRSRIAGETDAEYAAYVNSGAMTRSMVTSDADFARIKEWGLRSDKQTVGDAMYDMLVTDLRPELGHIHTPILVMGTWIGLAEAAQQPASPTFRSAILKEFEGQYAGAPQTTIVLADHARHFIMYDDPQWFFAQMDAFLKAHPAA